jgi:phosphoribosylamine--glycine ligase
VELTHSGTRRDGDRLVTGGGRVLSVTAVGADLDAARATAYEAIGMVTFAGAQYRTDIGDPGRLAAARRKV